jgi:hypothetical protein
VKVSLGGTIKNHLKIYTLISEFRFLFHQAAFRDVEKCRKRIEYMLCVPNEKDESKLLDPSYLESRSSASWEDITIPRY